MFLSSTSLINATRQQPGEGGSDVYPEDNRTALMEKAPEAFALVDKKWGTINMLYNYIINREGA